MGQELLDTQYEKKPRVYYLATTTNGMKFVRGSWKDRYTHAVVCSQSEHFRPNQIETWGTCHGRLDLAQRTFNRYNKTQYTSRYELVEFVKITAKEFRAIKRQTKKEYQEYREARDKEIQEEEKETESQ
jgi:hypothetical protein